MCRDFAHLVIAMLRARNVPARLVAVYAPGLSPMDFHAVVEAAIDGQWRVVDATTLAPRETLVRIATGRDASDTAFLTVQSGRADLVSMKVNATADPGPARRTTSPASSPSPDAHVPASRRCRRRNARCLGSVEQA